MQLQVLISFFFAYTSAVQAAPIELPANGLIDTLSIAAREGRSSGASLSWQNRFHPREPYPRSAAKRPASTRNIPILGQVLGGGSLLGRQVDASENALLSAIDLSPPFEANKALPSKPTTFGVSNANGELDSVLAPRKTPTEMLAAGFIAKLLSESSDFGRGHTVAAAGEPLEVAEPQDDVDDYPKAEILPNVPIPAANIPLFSAGTFFIARQVDVPGITTPEGVQVPRLAPQVVPDRAVDFSRAPLGQLPPVDLAKAIVDSAEQPSLVTGTTNEVF
ncbi:hypothetical protein BKA70DRAFT_1510109 [Coprinopsis sp. MPI-PUGE-AT-0042]|nr:hypothetical protein BKA70DRAFT_1510109 [Coprinopsis sp. MPI-PUGE-AT-0042]